MISMLLFLFCHSHMYTMYFDYMCPLPLPTPPGLCPGNKLFIKNVFRNRDLRCHGPIRFIHSFISHHIPPHPTLVNTILGSGNEESKCSPNEYESPES